MIENKEHFYTIPLTSEPNQSLRCVIPVNSNNLPLLFNIKYNSVANYWTMSVTDNITDELLLTGLPLIDSIYPSGNLLEQYTHLNIGSAFLIKINPDNADYGPNDNNLGKDFILVWGDNIGQ